MEWMTTEGELLKYKGADDNKGETKAKIAARLSKRMQDAGCLVLRSPKSIMDKIAAILESYKQAEDWRNNTGVGLETEPSFNQELTKRCQHYFDLHEILKDKASTRPLTLMFVESDDDDDDEDEEEAQEETQW